MRRAQCCQNKVRSALGCDNIGRFLQRLPSLGQGGNHQPIPIGQNLIVLERVRTRLTHRNQALPTCLKAIPQGLFGHLQPGGNGGEVLGKVGDIMLLHHARLTILPRSKVEHLDEQSSFVLTQDGPDLLCRPEIKRAFLALTVGVLSGVKTAFRRRHITQYIRGDLARCLGIQRFLRGLIGFGIEHQQQGLVIQHLLEMRYQPLSIGRIAMEAKTNVVVDPTTAHGPQGVFHHGQGLGLSGTFPVTQQETEHQWLGKLGSHAKAPMRGIVELRQMRIRQVERRLVQCRPC